MSEPIRVGIVGLGRWAKVLTRAARASDRIHIVTGYSRSPETRAAFAAEFADTGFAAAASMEAMLVDPSIKGVIITVPNEQHLPVAEQIAKAGLHIYSEKPIAATLTDGLKIEALQKQYGVTVTVGHSARLLAGVRVIKQKIDAGELGRVGFIEANFSNERALELTPQTWRWYKDKAPGGPLSQLAVHMFDIVHLLGGDVAQVSSIASKLSPVGAEVDDQSMSLVKFTNGTIAYVGTCWTSPGVFSVRVFGSKGLMHYEVDFGTWDTPSNLHLSSTLYIQRGKHCYGDREVLEIPPSDMFRDELEQFARSCISGEVEQLSAHNGNVAIAMMNSALMSIERGGALVAVDEIIEAARRP
ncbi:MAG: Gfo/Idh/MocA family oxidoreductase [Proteobacteria bacterium]|nr:Gfo/Idh/MocA family oxidoreductase [Burkholderiales bacterium]